ncbi:GHKL domain-containing protein [Lutibacter sp. B2]|nr:GHKL domain-containing protein [Lutibacter sp. B2]
MKFSIKFKSTIFIALLLLFTVVLLNFMVLNGLEKYQQRQYENYLNNTAKNANLFIQQEIGSNNVVNSKSYLSKNGQEFVMRLNTMTGLNMIMYDFKGKQIGSSFVLRNRPDLEKIVEHSLDGKRAYQIIGEVIYYSSPIRVADEQIGILEINYSIKEFIDFYNAIKKLFINVGVIVFTISFIGGLLYFRSFSKDILSLKGTVQKIKEGKYNDVSIIKRKDEIGELSEGIYFMNGKIKNQMIDMEIEHEKLKFAIKKLKEMKDQQKQFIGNITHEFKTPLTAIKAYVDLLEMYSDDPNLIEEARMNIGKESKRLFEMVKKILKLSSMEKYDFELRAEWIQVGEILEDVCKRLKGKAKIYGIKIYTDLQNIMVYVDKKNFIQIFMNLIDNAIKYTDADGQIHVKAYKHEDKVIIDVEDTGIGIPEDLRDKVFEPFFTVNDDRSRKISGTGLGLTLVKEFVEKQNGKIYLLETSNKGSIFRVELPVEK